MDIKKDMLNSKSNLHRKQSETITQTIFENKAHQFQKIEKERSYRDFEYQSQLMKSLVKIDSTKSRNLSKKCLSHLTSTTDTKYSGYRSKDSIPEWILSHDIWKVLKGRKLANEVSDILKVPFHERTLEQNIILVDWMMSVWPIAAHMGFNRVSAMMKEFNYTKFDPGDCIVHEGDHGLSFYVIISGIVEVQKHNVGIIGYLSKGATFGEIALTNQSHDGTADLRTATVTAIGNFPVEVLSLHKVDYDHFVRDIQLVEKRENFHLLKESKLVQYWPRSKLERLSNTAIRKLYHKEEEIIFRQGDPSNHIYFVLEGSVKIVKEVDVIATNKWPVGSNEWHEEKKNSKYPVMLNILQKGDYFGEVAVLRNCPRTATAIVNSPKTTLVLIDRIEFLHTFMLVSRHQFVSNIEVEVKRYKADAEVVRDVAIVKGGPFSFVKSGETIYYPNKPEVNYHNHNQDICNNSDNNFLSRKFSTISQEQSNILNIEIDNAQDTIQSYAVDLKRTLNTLFPTLSKDTNINVKQEKKSSPRKEKKRNIHNHISAKLAFQEEKTKNAISEILKEVIQHEAVYNYESYLRSLQLSSKPMNENNLELSNSNEMTQATVDVKEEPEEPALLVTSTTETTTTEPRIYSPTSKPFISNPRFSNQSSPKKVFENQLNFGKSPKSIKITTSIVKPRPESVPFTMSHQQSRIREFPYLTTNKQDLISNIESISMPSLFDGTKNSIRPATSIGYRSSIILKDNAKNPKHYFSL